MVLETGGIHIVGRHEIGVWKGNNDRKLQGRDNESACILPCRELRLRDHQAGTALE